MILPSEVKEKPSAAPCLGGMPHRARMGCGRGPLLIRAPIRRAVPAEPGGLADRRIGCKDDGTQANKPNGAGLPAAYISCKGSTSTPRATLFGLSRSATASSRPSPERSSERDVPRKVICQRALFLRRASG